MRKSLVLAIVAVLCFSMTAFAGVPDPSRSTVLDSGASTACHYKFRITPAADVLTVTVTVRDAFDVAVASCSTSCTLATNAGTLAGGTDCCHGTVQTGNTDAFGAVGFDFDAINGRGSLDVVVTTHCVGDIVLATNTIEFTSTNLDGDAGGVTNVFDASVFAGCLGSVSPLAPPDVYCNYNCDAAVNVLDASFLAGGLGFDCTDATCP